MNSGQWDESMAQGRAPRAMRTRNAHLTGLERCQQPLGVVEMGQWKKKGRRAAPVPGHCEGAQPRAHTYAGVHQTC